MSDAAFVVGIDLGTTNTVVAYSERGQSPEILPLPQPITLVEQASLQRLPSFLYSPLSHELEPGSPAWLIGELARKRLAEAPARTIHSSKSWLSHAGVARTAPLLPWGSEASDLTKLSPVDAAALLLGCVRQAWELKFPAAPLSEQLVVLTVPASFDPVARSLTVTAAARAGLKVRLLEEPQAAFYALFAPEQAEELFATLCPGTTPALALVCDVGGGTCDLSLLRAERAATGEVLLERIAVGRHLLLGGDNMDLAIAHHAELELSRPSSQEQAPTLAGAAPPKLGPVEFASLTSQCQHAKELLLGTNTESITLTLLGSGSQLLQQARSVKVTRKEVEQLVLEGFFPEVARDCRPERRALGFVSTGLPYERDPRITAHLVDFLARAGNPPAQPRAVLFNGGVFHCQAIRERVTAVLRSLQPSLALSVLESPSLDDAVALGAVRYGLALRGQGLRIQSGASHGYYIEVAAGKGRKGVCVVPRGTKEGEVQIAAVENLTLHTGQEVVFQLYASALRPLHAPGQVVELDPEAFELLPPVMAEPKAEHEGALPVHLEGEMTAIGTLALACVSVTPKARFELEFELRGQEAPHKPPSHAPVSKRSALLNEAHELLQRVFGKGRSDVKEREVKDLLRNLERLFGERRSWDLLLCRELFDTLAPKAAARRRSEDHERVFWMLAGLCLRPGFGHRLDPGRVARLSSLFGEALTFGDHPRTWQAFFISWRRIAAGLDEATQLAIRDKLDPFLSPASLGLKKPKGWRPQAPEEMLELASWLECVPAAKRAALGEWVLERTWTSRDPRLWAALGRIGARVPAYASAHTVVAARVVEPWVEHLLREPWESPVSARAAAQLARITGDRLRDISEPLRLRVLERLRRVAAPQAWVAGVEALVESSEAERLERFDEDLPAGLSLGARA